MSRFIVTIEAAGLIERPPLSKVIPLPTSTTCGADRALRGRLVGQLDEPRRRRSGLSDADDAAETLVGQLLLVEHAGRQPGPLRGLDGLVGQPRRGLDVGRHARQQPGPPARPAAATARSSRAAAPRRPPSARARPHRPAGPSGPSRCSEKPKEPRIAPSVNAAIASRSPTAATEEATESAFVVRRARVAPARRRSVGVPAPTPTSSTRERGPAVAAVSVTGSSVTSPGRRWRRCARARRAGRCRGPRRARRRPARARDRRQGRLRRRADRDGDDADAGQPGRSQRRSA